MSSYSDSDLTIRWLAPVLFAFLGALSAPSRADAQVIVYDPQANAQPGPAPMPTVVPEETYGNLVGRNAFYGRLSLGIGSEFFRVADPVTGDSAPLLSGIGLHTDFSLGARFAFVHALTFDFDFNRGFSPSLDGSTDAFPDGTFYGGSFGVSYTNFLRGTGLYVGLGVGLGVAWVEYDDGFSSTASSNTGLGPAFNGRVGYDWTLGRRAHFGTAFLLRVNSYTDEDELTWRGAAFAGTASVAWY